MKEKTKTFVPGFVDGLVGLDKNCCALAVNGHGGVVVEDVSALSEVPVPPNLEKSLTPQVWRHLSKITTATALNNYRSLANTLQTDDLSSGLKAKLLMPRICFFVNCPDLRLKDSTYWHHDHVYQCSLFIERTVKAQLLLDSPSVSQCLYLKEKEIYLVHWKTLYISNSFWIWTRQ